MKTLVLELPGVLKVETRDRPEPGPGEVRVRIAFGGICGSDLHYYLHGGFGTVRMREPMVLGHEISGTVDAVGAGVTNVSPGQLVAVNPSNPCGSCPNCKDGASRFCDDMRFMGSAMRNPPVQGGFREYITCTAAQAVPYDGDNIEEAALAEPLAVCLHAVAQAPGIRGGRVLITGMGPIGALCVLASRHAGAAEIIVTDITDAPFDLARRLGADRTINVTAPGALDAETAGRGNIDVTLECSGHHSAIANALAATRPRGTVVQVGMLPATVEVPLNAVVTKELNFRGTFRFDAEFDRAVGLIASREIDIRPLISARFPLEQGEEAFATAQDRNKAMKVLLAVA